MTVPPRLTTAQLNCKTSTSWFLPQRRTIFDSSSRWRRPGIAPQRQSPLGSRRSWVRLVTRAVSITQSKLTTKSIFPVAHKALTSMLTLVLIPLTSVHSMYVVFEPRYAPDGLHCDPWPGARQLDDLGRGMYPESPDLASHIQQARGPGRIWCPC
ncbi:hypothetical protein BS17DRAFT_168039 [Gyrodon lividus]|nr:hypothetical protein BS17DRAFT_168039 [Gyrodon lividus]